MVAEMSKDTGMAIHKSIVLLFLSCLVAILGFHFLQLKLCFLWGGGGESMVHGCGCSCFVSYENTGQ